MTPSASRFSAGSAARALARGLRRDRITMLVLLGVLAAGAGYAIAGRALVHDMYAGTSWSLLNRIIARQDQFDLVHYQRKFDLLVYGYGAMLVLATALFRSLWTGRRMAAPVYAGALALFTLANIAFTLPVHDFGAYIILDDFPKFHSTGIENARSLLAYGSPFGYNHYFQGGVPAFYMKSTFLPLLPFLMLFGEAIGHQLMLVVALLAIPLSFYALLRATLGYEAAARVAAFLAALEIRSIGFLNVGMVPAALSISLAFLGLLFLHRHTFAGRSRLWLPAALLALTVLLYTHLLYFVLVWAVYAAILAWNLLARGARGALPRALHLALLMLLAGLPFLVTFIDHFEFFHSEPEYGPSTGTAGRILDTVRYELRIFAHPGSANTLLLLAIVFLAAACAQSEDPRFRRAAGRVLAAAAGILAAPLLQTVAHLAVIAHRATIFAPFAALAAASLALAMDLKPRTKALAALLLLFLALCHYPFHPCIPETAASLTDIDPEIHRFVAPEDHVLFENTSHVSPMIERCDKTFRQGPYGHWLTSLQRVVGARFFANVGEDPHPYNKKRHLYVTSGSYRGRPLEGANGDALLDELERWGVHKACVWSEPAIAFFSTCERFVFVGRSARYHCFRALAAPLPEVRLSGSGRGRILAQSAFGLTIAFENIRGPETATVARNPFRNWSARDDRGREIPLAAGAPMIAFPVERDGVVRLTYRRHTVLYLLALAALALSFLPLPARASRTPVSAPPPR